jgi:fibronectin-binding autotransporter adhesin
MARRIEAWISTPTPCKAALAITLAIALSRAALAQTPVGMVANIPAPDNNAFSTSLRFDQSGNLYAWDGLSVWEQSGGGFNNIGSVAAGNSADAGPITFSQDGQSLLLGNGSGGYGFAGNGLFWTMSAAGGMAAQVPGSGVPYTYDALALPAGSGIPGSHTKYLVYAGNSTFDGSSLSIFDASTGANQVVVNNGPGASTSIAINPKTDRVYVGVGYGASAGDIYSFSLAQIDAAYNSGSPINFNLGTLFNPAGGGSQSGSGMFFDSNGYLFAGGDGITVFQPNGLMCYDQPAGAGDNYYDIVSYNPANNELLKVPYGASAGTLYRATDFESTVGSISIISGTNTITAPLVLAGNVYVSTSAAGALELGNISQAAGISAALILSGDGQLILSGTDSYTGGTVVNSGDLIVATSLGLPEGSSLLVGSGAQTIFADLAAGQASPAMVHNVPEPCTFTLTAAGLLGFAIYFVRLSSRVRPLNAAFR